MSITRRGILRAGVAGAAFGIIGLRSKSGRASGPPNVKRLLVFNAGGGIRNVAAFNAINNVTYNPWGVHGVAGALSLGNILFDPNTPLNYAAPSWANSPTVPSIDKAAPNFAMIGAVNHDVTGYRVGDHTDETPRMGTGYFGTQSPGFLTVISRYGAMQNPVLPVCMIGAAGACGTAFNDWAPFQPVGIAPTAMPVGSGLAPANTYPVEDSADQTLRTHRNGLAGSALDQYLNVKAAIRKYGPTLTRPELNLFNAGNLGVAVNGITNQMLLEAMGNTVTTTSAGDSKGLAVAAAIRILQMGSPAVAVGYGTFDYHSQEKEKGPSLYTTYARHLAGIYFALSNIPDPAGTGSMLDTTLVITTSEFDRCAEQPAGFNPADGSGHAGGSNKNPHQPHVVFGGGVKPGLLLAAVDRSSNQLDPSKQHSTHALLSTLCLAMGVPQDQIDRVWPVGSPLYWESGPILDLWS